MTIIGLLIAIILFALLYWLLTRLPIDPGLKRILIIVLLVIAILVVLWLLLGIFGTSLNARVP